MEKCKLIAAVTGLVLTAGSAAYAADMPVKAAPPLEPPAPLYNWNGFYLGVNLGGAWANNSSSSFSGNMAGVTGGGQIGWNWVTNGSFFGSSGVLLGFEGDFNGSSQKNSNGGTLAGIPFNVDTKMPWFATARGRLGLVNGPWLVYVTGGGAWVNFQADISAPGGTVTDHTTKSGWAVGGGVEWMFLPKWSAKLEYLYIDTNSSDVTLFGQTFSAKAQENVVRVGLNYHF
jgi:outer membrane immunogenic protein